MEYLYTMSNLANRLFSPTIASKWKKVFNANHNLTQSAKCMWCVNVFMLFASLHKLQSHKHWIIRSAANLIIHPDDLIMSIRQMWDFFPTKSPWDPNQNDKILVYTDEEWHFNLRVSHTTSTPHLPRAPLAVPAVYSALTGFASSLLTLFGPVFLWILSWC